jgi:recombination protein RecA
MSLQTDASRPVQPLPELLAALRDRGLRQGVDPGPMAPRDALSSGQPALDDALRTGGWPRGSLALLDGPAGSGATSLALGSLAAAQAAGGVVAYLDPGGSLDPATAARLGVSLEWLLVVRPADGAETLELAAWLARDGRIDALVLDLADAPDAVNARALDRLAGLLVRTGSVALLLAGGAARAAAGVRVALRRRAWLAVGSDLVGQRVEATVERHRWALAGGRAELDLWFAEGRRVDPLLRAAATPLPVERVERVERLEGLEPPALAVAGA